MCIFFINPPIPTPGIGVEGRVKIFFKGFIIKYMQIFSTPPHCVPGVLKNTVCIFFLKMLLKHVNIKVMYNLA